MERIIEYYAKNGSHIKFEKYTIDTRGLVKNIETGNIVNTQKNGVYNTCSVYDNFGKRRSIQLCRAILSTFVGPPLTTKYTADHINRDTNADTLDNLRWASESEQKKNRIIPETYKSVFIIVRDNIEKNVKEWADHLKDKKNHMKREYTTKMISHYAQKKRHGFSYKEYPDLQGEVWKEIMGSKTNRGDYWEISNMNRIKYVTKYAENVLSGDRIGVTHTGYPIIMINGNKWLCHILAFKTFFPDEYSVKKSGEVILHEEDNKLDFRPFKLRIGTQRENITDAHNNGCYDGKKTARMRCVSYIDGVYELLHDSHTDAEKYLKHIGYDKASSRNIRTVLSGDRNTAYDRTWKTC